MIRLKLDAAELFVPDGLDAQEALARTTHVGIGAHQDDLETMAIDGILKCLQRDDQWFCGVVATNDSGSPQGGVYKDYSDEDMHLVRRKEQKKTAVEDIAPCPEQLRTIYRGSGAVMTKTDLSGRKRRQVSIHGCWGSCFKSAPVSLDDGRDRGMHQQPATHVNHRQRILARVQPSRAHAGIEFVLYGLVVY